VPEVPEVQHRVGFATRPNITPIARQLARLGVPIPKFAMPPNQRPERTSESIQIEKFAAVSLLDVANFSIIT
jgi:hypothetical protein